MSYNSSFIPTPVLPAPTVQSQASGNPNTYTLPVPSQDLFQNNALNQYNAPIRQLMHAYSQLQLTNLTMAGTLPVPPVVPAPPALPRSLSGPAPQFGIPTMPQPHPVLPINPSSILEYVRLQHSTNHLTVASQLVPPHSHMHHHRTSAPANSHETRGHRDSNRSRNAMNMAKRF